MGFSRRTLRWAVPTTALAVRLAWGVFSGGIRLAVAPDPTEPAPPHLIGRDGPSVVPLPTDHLRPIRMVLAPPDDAERFRWRLTAEHNGGRRLALSVVLGCGPIVGASVVEGTDRVTLSVFGPPRPRAGACVASKVIVFRSVRLPHPLGERLLRHG